MLSRQDLPVQANASAEGVAKGAYVLREAEGDERAVLVATGSEVWVAMDAAEQLEAEGIGTRVVSMPSWELFDAQGDEYREEILPPDLPSVSVEAGIAMGWSKYVDASVEHRPLRRERPRRRGPREARHHPGPRGEQGPRAARGHGLAQRGSPLCVTLTLCGRSGEVACSAVRSRGRCALVAFGEGEGEPSRVR